MGHGFLGSDEVPELVLVVGGSPRTSPTLNRGTVSAAPDMVREHEISNRPLANGPGLLRHLPIVKIDIGYEGQINVQCADLSHRAVAVSGELL